MERMISILALLTVLAACVSEEGTTGGIATGMLKTRDYIVTMYAGSNGPLYSVRSLGGDMLDEDISMETMVARYPELDYLQDNDNIDWAGLDTTQRQLDATNRPR